MTKLAIIGTGAVANEHVKRYREIDNCDVTSVYDIDEICSKDFAKKHNIKNVYKSIDELLDNKFIEGVSVTVPDEHHCSVSIKVMERGKAILCEKPLAPKTSEAQLMVDIAKSSKVINMVNFSYRRTPVLQMANNIIKSGGIGKIKHLEATYLNGWLTHKVQGDWRTQPHQLWRLSKSHGSNGVLFDLGSHLLDFVIFPAGDIVKVNCLLQTLNKSPDDQIGEYYFDSNDSAIITAEFENGAIGSMNITRWGTGHLRRIRLNIFADKGAIEIETEKSENELQLCIDDDVEKANFNTKLCPPVPTIYSRFVNSIQTGINEQPDFVQGLKVTKILEACLISSKERRSVDIE